ncbi:MAG: hypothetical protein U0359_30325 [Byssovorax sp.]
MPPPRLHRCSPLALSAAIGAASVAMGLALGTGCSGPWPLVPGGDAGTLATATMPTVTPAASCAPLDPPPRFAEALVLDWPKEQRDRLTAALQTGEGLAAARFDGCAVELVPSCQLSGRYRFTRLGSMQPPERRLYGNNEIPAAASEIAARDGGPISLDLWKIGTFDADLPQALSFKGGECGRATHVIASAAYGVLGVGSTVAPSMRSEAGEACLNAAAPSNPSLPACARPLSVILARLPVEVTQPVPSCAKDQAPRGQGCVPDVPALASDAPEAESAKTLLDRLAASRGADRGELLFSLAQLYKSALPDPQSAVAISKILRPFVDPALREHPKLLDALLLYRGALVALGRLDELLEASSILVKTFPDDARVAPAFLDLARHYCTHGDPASADSFFEELNRRFFLNKQAAATVAEANKLRASCRAAPKSPPKARSPGSIPPP